MNKSLFSILMIVATLSGITISEQVQARIKCWKNNEGIKECGDKVPPEYAQKGHQELGKGGVIRKKTERAKTDKELVEAKRLAKIEAKKLKEEEKQKNHDNILLKTFTTVDDIERVRDERVTALETSIKLAKLRNNKIQLDLDKRINSAATDEKNNKTPSEYLLKDIESLKRQIKNNNMFIADKQGEQERIKQAHALDIERFKKLKGIK